MYIKTQQNASSHSIDDVINALRKKLKTADRIIIGAGSGLSASAGLNYNDNAYFIDHYHPFLEKGYRNISEAMMQYWHLCEGNAISFWGFWAYHINTTYHQAGQKATYKLLYDIIKDKNYFVVTTNADGQFFKGDFDPNKIFAMQGSYGMFQCQKKCHDLSYDNHDMVRKMLKGFDEDALEIRGEDVPRCPKCGGLLCPNLRMDETFVEGDHMVNSEAYTDFINGDGEAPLFFELGVGFNTPTIIRYPFEEMAGVYDDALLVRVNLTMPQFPDYLEGKAMSTTTDIHELLTKLGKK